MSQESALKPENKPSYREIKSIQEIANYEGNHFLLLVERLQNLVVFNRLVDDIYNDRTSVDFSNYDYIDPDYVKSLERDEYFVKQDIKVELIEKIKITLHSTEIGFSEYGYLESNKGSEGTGYVGVCNGTLGITFNETILTKNITEAHEKGHNIRDYNSDSEFSKELQSMFDFNRVSLSDEDIDFLGKKDDNVVPREETELSFREYIAYPWEIIERMSQLKNYFGMSGLEEFTQEHLDYARSNYIKDTGTYPLQIQPFFDSIIDDKKFIEKMNTLGI